MHPTLKDSESAKRSVAFLPGCWENRGKIRCAGHDSQIGTGWDKLKYPFTDYHILKYLDTLSRLSYARKDPGVLEMTGLLISKRDEEGLFQPESTTRSGQIPTSVRRNARAGG